VYFEHEILFLTLFYSHDDMSLKFEAHIFGQLTYLLILRNLYPSFKVFLDRQVFIIMDHDYFGCFDMCFMMIYA
jgi:hypothetical protein